MQFHKFGLFPAKDSMSAATHQLYAYHTACAAAIEWIGILEKDSVVKKAIKFAKGWDAAKAKGSAGDDLDDGLSAAKMVSCIMGKWDGASPPMDRDKECGTFKLLGHIHIPKMSNLFLDHFLKIVFSKKSPTVSVIQPDIIASIHVGGKAPYEKGLAIKISDDTANIMMSAKCAASFLVLQEGVR